MRRLLGGSLGGRGAAAFGLFTGSARAVRWTGASRTALCTEPADSIGYGGEYTGHDEPSLLFYSDTPGSGNSNLYHVQLPTDPKVLPNQAGTAGTWNFQLHPAYWFGMALCDNQSAPEFTHAPCVPDSDTNIFDGTDPAAPDYIGKPPGHRLPRGAVLPARLGALASGHQLRREPVVCVDGDLQPQPGPEHGRR